MVTCLHSNLLLFTTKKTPLTFILKKKVKYKVDHNTKIHDSKGLTNFKKCLKTISLKDEDCTFCH